MANKIKPWEIHTKPKADPGTPEAHLDWLIGKTARKTGVLAEENPGALADVTEDAAGAVRATLDGRPVTVAVTYDPVVADPAQLDAALTWYVAELDRMALILAGASDDLTDVDLDGNVIRGVLDGQPVAIVAVYDAL